MENATFEGFAILELNGHNKEIGFVTTCNFGGPSLFRVDQPELPAREYELIEVIRKQATPYVT